MIYTLADNSTEQILATVQYSAGELPRAGDVIEFDDLERVVVSVHFRPYAQGTRYYAQEVPVVYVK